MLQCDLVAQAFDLLAQNSQFGTQFVWCHPAERTEAAFELWLHLFTQHLAQEHQFTPHFVASALDFLAQFLQLFQRLDR